MPPIMQQWMLEASRSFQSFWVTVGTRARLWGLLNVKTSNSLYLKKLCYSSRCKLNTKNRKWGYWSVWQQTLRVPTSSACFTVKPSPSPLPQHCNSSGSALPATLLPHILHHFLRAAQERREGTEKDRSLQSPLLKCTSVDGIPAHQQSAQSQGAFTIVTLSLGRTLEALQKSTCTPYCNSS